MKNLLLVAVMLAIVACSASAQKNLSSPTGWTLIKACSAEFYLPPDFKEERVQGIDSCVKKYRGKNTVMVLDVLGYITPDASRREEYSEEREFRYEITTVGGRRSEIITCILQNAAEGLNYAAVLFVPQMGKDGGNLTIWLNSKSPEERERVMKLFQTVRFPKE